MVMYYILTDKRGLRWSEDSLEIGHFHCFTGRRGNYKVRNEVWSFKFYAQVIVF